MGEVHDICCRSRSIRRRLYAHHARSIATVAFCSSIFEYDARCTRYARITTTTQYAATHVRADTAASAILRWSSAAGLSTAAASSSSPTGGLRETLALRRIRSHVEGWSRRAKQHAHGRFPLSSSLLDGFQRNAVPRRQSQKQQ